MNVLTEFQAAIDIERLKTLADFDEQMNQPLDERVAKGVTMSNLKVEFNFFDGLPNQYCSNLPAFNKYIFSAKIICDNNISKFKEGKPVILSNGLHKFEMEIDEDSTENFILKANDFNVKTCYIDSNDYPRNNWEINEAKVDITAKLLLSAAQVLINDSSTLKKIDGFLNGKTKNSFENYSQRVNYLNESQNTAYLNAINAHDFCIIQGPPGTGKTETIGNITKQLIESGLNVFITAPTNTAINNCINAIASKVCIM
jgi:DNA replication ATP-dependent helicase Dna2